MTQVQAIQYKPLCIPHMLDVLILGLRLYNEDLEKFRETFEILLVTGPILGIRFQGSDWVKT